jgi:guanylate kinase
VSTAPHTNLSRRGFCFILSSPSGAGKTTLVRRLMESGSNLILSLSVTTRQPRPQERDGLDYHFVSKKEFATLRDNGELLEWAEVFGNFYGTPAGPVKKALVEGRDVIFDIDWQGAAAIARLLPEDTVRVFILPPSHNELTRRIYTRASDADDVIAARLKAAGAEMSHWKEYDYLIVNHDIEESLSKLKSILEAERQKRHRHTGIEQFLEALTIENADTAAPGRF